MGLKEKIQAKYPNLEVVPNDNSVSREAVESAAKTPLTFAQLKEMTGNVSADANNKEETGAQDRGWFSFAVRPKNAVNNQGGVKIRIFDENGDEVASQG